MKVFRQKGFQKYKRPGAVGENMGELHCNSVLPASYPEGKNAPAVQREVHAGIAGITLQLNRMLG